VQHFCHPLCHLGDELSAVYDQSPASFEARDIYNDDLPLSNPYKQHYRKNFGSADYNMLVDIAQRTDESNAEIPHTPVSNCAATNSSNAFAALVC